MRYRNCAAPPRRQRLSSAKCQASSHQRQAPGADCKWRATHLPNDRPEHNELLVPSSRRATRILPSAIRLASAAAKMNTPEELPSPPARLSCKLLRLRCYCMTLHRVTLLAAARFICCALRRPLPCPPPSCS